MALRILSAQISHETNTFSATPTTLESFRLRTFWLGADVTRNMRGTKTELGAHIDAAEKYGWELVQPIIAHATPAGRVTKATWEIFVRTICDAAHGVDGVLLALHGAMVVEEIDDAEGELLSILRRQLGDRVPFSVSLDMHANVSQRMADLSNAIVTYRTYPHVDHYPTGTLAAELLDRMLRTGERFRVAYLQPATLDGCDFGRTHAEAKVMPSLLAQADAVQAASPDIAAIAVCAGFPWSDIESVGPSVCVTGTGSVDALKALAAPLAERIWTTRHMRSVQYASIEEAVDHARRAPAGGPPLVIGDATDNPGQGAPGNNVALLEAFLAAGISGVAVACISDPSAVRACIAAGEGSQVSLELGSLSGQHRVPLKVAGTVTLTRGDARFVISGTMRKGLEMSLGPTAVLQVAGITVIIATANLQVIDLEILRCVGLRPEGYRVLVIKSQQHFRNAFTPIASSVLIVDSKGAVSPDLTHLDYKRTRRPIWPLDSFSE